MEEARKKKKSHKEERRAALLYMYVSTLRLLLVPCPFRRSGLWRWCGRLHIYLFIFTTGSLSVASLGNYFRDRTWRDRFVEVPVPLHDGNAFLPL